MLVFKACMDITQSMILCAGGTLLGFLILMKLTRDNIIPSTKRVVTSDTREDLTSLRQAPNYGNEMTSKSRHRENPVDRTGMPDKMTTLARDINVDLLASPAPPAYVNLKPDVPPVSGNPVFGQV